MAFIRQNVCPVFIALFSTHAWTARFGLGMFLCAAVFVLAQQEYRHIAWTVRWGIIRHVHSHELAHADLMNAAQRAS